ncbi:uncharacterized protein LOC108194965 isoform X1 [Daucus carota subsp. sativus]|uniref:uncharacterized protein LOC108194965 isoform X1 n=1 Tax=Daucus carota subsp. sativus TaxID=79200 RepID=UPI0007EEFD47|nr:PREDICTED: uncharacterized protein LOC108194964 [Daucus carota subsp. sativus]
MEHFSHPKHLLILREDDDFRENDICCVCNKPVLASPTYICTSSDHSDCQSFYLHKSCAELPTIIDHHKHNQHPLTLLARPDEYICDVCSRLVKFAYACEECTVDVCVFCGLEQRVLCHEGHQQHKLTLMNREALFKCDACGEEDKDSSYVCTTCEFWIHKTCALSPYIIPTQAYHHHPLFLIYSIPQMHRQFERECNICHEVVYNINWMYYCHKCTYFVHMRCAMSSDTVPIVTDTEAADIDDETVLLQFPLPHEESLFDLIITQCGKFQVDLQGEGESSTPIPDNPHIIEGHWSHENHQLEQLQFATSNDDNDDNDDDRRVMICNGCIQPITDTHPSYYACVQCGFFLHSFCATKLPPELPRGASSFHPSHSLVLYMSDQFYGYVDCEVCGYCTNGFYYKCEDCDIKIDIRCAFLPKRIKHRSHKRHSLVQRPFSNSICSVSNLKITNGVEYACETCSSFQIHIDCVIYPSRMNHRYDLHAVTLREPPFFYEGVFYCEICEEQVNNQRLLYHCDECDHSFHHYCLRWYESFKFGGIINRIIQEQPHALALVLKRTARDKSPLYICGICEEGYNFLFFFECGGCGFLVCCNCFGEITDSTNSTSGSGSVSC